MDGDQLSVIIVLLFTNICILCCLLKL